MMYLDAFAEATGDYVFIVGQIIRDLPWPWLTKPFTMDEVFLD